MTGNGTDGGGSEDPLVDTDVAVAVRDYLTRHLSSMVELLSELVLLESPSIAPERQTPVFARLAAAFEAVGLSARVELGARSGGYLVARPPDLAPGSTGQLLLGHCDTVWPVGTLAEMPLRIADGKVYGPGAYDMKAGLVQMIYALGALKALGLAPVWPPVVFVNSDEEIGSDDSAAPMVALAAQMARVFVLEPSLGSAGKLKTARKGVGQFRLAIQGRAAHAGLAPEEGVSAVLEMAYQIQALASLNDPVQGVTVNVGTVQGGVRPNVVAPSCEAEIDVRIVTAAQARAIESQLRSLRPRLPGATVSVTGSVDRPPLERTARNQALWAVAEQLGRQMGLQLEEAMAGGASDGNLTSAVAPTLDGLGPVGDGAHARHEHVVIAAMAERATLLALLLLVP
jgi:glutamate carboxypeptidase